MLSSYSAVADWVIAFRSSGSSSAAPVEPSLLYSPSPSFPSFSWSRREVVATRAAVR